MKLLIISTLYNGGGAELQSKFEFDYLLNNGYDVRYVTFDPSLKTGESQSYNHINLYGEYSLHERRFSDLFHNKKIINILSNYLNDFSPDVVHLHQVNFAFCTICKTLNGYRIFQTIHDVSVICDKGTCIMEEGIICDGTQFFKCLKNCYSQSFKRRLKFIYRFFVMKRNKYFRLRYIEKLISPSYFLSKYLNNVGYDAVCINNAINIKDFSNFKKNLSCQKRIVLYFGAIRKGKGVIELLRAFDPKKHSKIELHLIGKFDNGRIEDSISVDHFIKLVEGKKAIYHGPMKHKDVISFLQQTFAVIVPSVVMENYPTTAIEGMLSRCIVCGSNRGGIPELIKDKRFIFDIMDINDISSCLSLINNISLNEYNTICENQIAVFNKNNRPDYYFEQFFSLIRNNNLNIKK